MLRKSGSSGAVSNLSRCTPDSKQDLGRYRLLGVQHSNSKRGSTNPSDNPIQEICNPPERIGAQIAERKKIIFQHAIMKWAPHLTGRPLSMADFPRKESACTTTSRS